MDNSSDININQLMNSELGYSREYINYMNNSEISRTYSTVAAATADDNEDDEDNYEESLPAAAGATRNSMKIFTKDYNNFSQMIGGEIEAPEGMRYNSRANNYSLQLNQHDMSNKSLVKFREATNYIKTLNLLKDHILNYQLDEINKLSQNLIYLDLDQLNEAYNYLRKILADTVCFYASTTSVTTLIDYIDIMVFGSTSSNQSSTMQVINTVFKGEITNKCSDLFQLIENNNLKIYLSIILGYFTEFILRYNNSDEVTRNIVENAATNAIDNVTDKISRDNNSVANINKRDKAISIINRIKC